MASKRPLITFHVDDGELRDRVVAIAAARGTRDRLGRGFSAELRKFVRDYDRRYRHLLEDRPDA